MINTAYDNQEIYCRKLGHHLHFKYCREENLSLPCSKIRECWFSRIDVSQFLSENFSDEEVRAIESPAMPKISSIVGLITRITKESE